MHIGEPQQQNVFCQNEKKREMFVHRSEMKLSETITASWHTEGPESCRAASWICAANNQITLSRHPKEKHTPQSQNILSQSQLIDHKTKHLESPRIADMLQTSPI